MRRKGSLCELCVSALQPKMEMMLLPPPTAGEKWEESGPNPANLHVSHPPCHPQALCLHHTWGLTLPCSQGIPDPMV